MHTIDSFLHTSFRYNEWVKKKKTLIKAKLSCFLRKLFKKLIITSISTRNSFTMQWETILWWAKSVVLSKTWNWTKNVKCFINFNHKSFWYISSLVLWLFLIFQQTVWLLFESLEDWGQYLSYTFNPLLQISLAFKRLVKPDFMYFLFHFIPKIIIEGIAIRWRGALFMSFDKTWTDCLVKKLARCLTGVKKNPFFVYVKGLNDRQKFFL